MYVDFSNFFGAFFRVSRKENICEERNNFTAKIKLTLIFIKRLDFSNFVHN